MTFSPQVTDQAELHAAWTELMGAGGFGSASVWMMMIVEGRPVPQLTEITGTHLPPDPEDAVALARLLELLARDLPDLSIAFLRSRPGAAPVTGVDRAWATALYTACREAAVPCEVVHLATAHGVRPLPPDELPGAISA